MIILTKLLIIKIIINLCVLFISSSFVVLCNVVYSNLTHIKIWWNKMKKQNENPKAVFLSSNMLYISLF
jgi:hypothetical protein